MLAGGIVVAGLTSTSPWVSAFVVECYSDSGLTTRVDTQSVQAIFDPSVGKYVQKDLIGFVGLLPSTQYWFRAGTVAPVYGTVSWSSTFTETAGIAYSTQQISQNQQFTFGTDTGAANAYAVTLTPAPTLVAGLKLSFVAAHSNTGASTLALNGGAAKNITKNGTTPLVSGDIAAGQIISVTYDGTQFQMVTTTASQPFLLVFPFDGKPAANTEYILEPFPIPVTFPGNFSGAVGKCLANPAATATFTLKKNGSSCGTFAISTSGTFTFTSTSGAPVSFSVNDYMSIVTPTVQDTTLADVGVTLLGTR